MKSYRITIKGRDYDVVVGDTASNPVSVTVDGVEHQVQVPGRGTSASVPARPPSTPSRSLPSAPSSAPRPAVPTSGADGTIRALMPGRIISISVSAGQAVTAGQAVLVMESMKMENTVSATADGTVKAVLVAEGDSVQHGQSLIEFES
jgi:biotin carboxyl carrier protein